MSAELDKAVEIVAGHVTEIDDNGFPVLGHIHDVIDDDFRTVLENFTIAKQHGLTNDEFTKRVCEAYAKRVAK